MFFTSADLEKEYLRISNLNPDIEELQHPLINVSDTLRAYFALADYFTDPTSDAKESMLIGVRSMDLLYSALTRQNVSFCGKVKYSNPIDICSTLFYGMVKNHSFSDGNKRTALLILLYQLNLYNYLPNASINAFEKLVVAVAANELPTKYFNIWKKYKKQDDPEIRTISHILRKTTKRKDHSYHLKITIKDMATSLEKYDVASVIDNGKIHFVRTVTAKWPKKKETYQFVMNFGGWTRCIGASAARDLLTSLNLYDQIPDYQSIINGDELFYNLIEEFEGPLRRLKDE